VGGKIEKKLLVYCNHANGHTIKLTGTQNCAATTNNSITVASIIRVCTNFQMAQTKEALAAPLDENSCPHICSNL